LVCLWHGGHSHYLCFEKTRKDEPRENKIEDLDKGLLFADVANLQQAPLPSEALQISLGSQNWPEASNPLQVWALVFKTPAGKACG